MHARGRSTLAPEAVEPLALHLAGVDALYGDNHVLRDVSFSLRRGRVLALLGRNGAGKTTCMNAIVGFLKARRGDIRLFDQSLVGLSPEAISRRGVGFVPQGRRIFHSLTVFENLCVAMRKARPDSAAKWDVADVFARFPVLGQRQKQVAGSLSGGEQQMLAIGRALMGNPRVLLMDEPSEGLAPQIVAEVGRTIAQLKAEGLSIVLVEQNIKLTLGLADEVVIVNTGAVVFHGTAAETEANTAVISQHLGVF